MSIINTVLGNPIPAIVIAFLALTFSIATFAGCDYARLTFGAINDNTEIFPNDEFFGLGLFRHEDFSNNKNTRSWEHSSECYDYTTLDTLMFRDSNIKRAGVMFIPAIVFSALTLFSVLSMKYRGVLSKFMMIATVTMAIVSAILQILVFGIMLDESGDSVCNVARYGADIDDKPAWYVKFPAATYPYVSYMRFMQGCELGSTAKIALAGIIFQILVALFTLLHSLCATDEDTSGVSSVPMVSEIPRFEPVAKSKSIDEEAQDQTIEGSHEHIGPLARSAPEPIIDDKFDDDNISYDNGIDDENQVEDDLSLAEQEEPAAAPDENQAEDDLSLAEQEEPAAAPEVEADIDVEETETDAAPGVPTPTPLEAPALTSAEVEVETFTEDVVPAPIEVPSTPSARPVSITPTGTAKVLDSGTF
jgi:heme/copper-type cytochrome/quinol oxidase subunit 4